MLGAVILALDDNTGRNVRDADGAVRSINMLTASPRRTVSVDAQVFVINDDVDRVVDHGIDADRSEARMTSSRGIIRRYAHQAMNTCFRL